MGHFSRSFSHFFTSFSSGSPGPALLSFPQICTPLYIITTATGMPTTHFHASSTQVHSSLHSMERGPKAQIAMSWMWIVPSRPHVETRLPLQPCAAWNLWEMSNSRGGISALFFMVVGRVYSHEHRLLWNGTALLSPFTHPPLPFPLCHVMVPSVVSALWLWTS